MPSSPGNEPGSTWRLASTVTSGLPTGRATLVKDVREHHARRGEPGALVDAPGVVVARCQEREIGAGGHGQGARDGRGDPAPAVWLQHADPGHLREAVARRREE